jgi:hypothetical protein
VGKEFAVGDADGEIFDEDLAMGLVPNYVAIVSFL